MKISNFKIFVLLFSTIFFLSIVSPLFAQQSNQNSNVNMEEAPPPSCTCDKECEPGGLMKEVSPECACCGCCELVDILKIIRGVANIILKWVGLIAFAFFIVGGIMWLTSGGNPEQVKRGKQILISTLIGLAIVFLSWTIVNSIICILSKGEIKPACEIFNQPWYKFLK